MDFTLRQQSRPSACADQAEQMKPAEDNLWLKDEACVRQLSVKGLQTAVGPGAIACWPPPPLLGSIAERRCVTQPAEAEQHPLTD